ncbi:MAG: ATP-binding protein [Pseudomonadota bacterium]
MDGPFPALIEIVLTAGRLLALQLNDKLAIRIVHNAPLLAEWRGHGDAMPGSLHLLLEELLPLAEARTVLRQVETQAGDVDVAGATLGIVALRMPRGGGPDRHAELSLHRGADPAAGLLLLLRDVTPQVLQQQAHAQTQQALDAALGALRAPPKPLRLFLPAAMTAFSALRAIMKMPARTQEAVHAKLTRLKEGADQLGADARGVGLPTVAAACTNFTLRVVALREKAQISGDDLLPLAPLLDRIASSVGDTARIEEQRYLAPSRGRANTRTATAAPETTREADDWARAAERGWNSFLRKRGAELGLLVKLQVQDAQRVPTRLRRDVDDMIQHLLRNAVEHGIEMPEQRVAADKPAAGQISVRFEEKAREGLVMTVRDDGRGFDIERIGRAAVRSGLLTEESLLEYDPGEVVGLIFKPAFSTEHLEGEEERGRGMKFLRRSVTRLGGQISVATKPGRYTRFVFQLPVNP